MSVPCTAIAQIVRGTGGNRTVDVCVPLAPTQGIRRYNEICHSDVDCRSAVCSGSRCREACCTDEDCDAPFVMGMYCAISGIPDVTACFVEPTVDNNPLGTLGCSTTGDPGDCRSDLCFAFYDPSTGCTLDAECTPARPTLSSPSASNSAPARVRVTLEWVASPPRLWRA